MSPISARRLTAQSRHALPAHQAGGQSRRGQILPIFALCMVVLVGMVGLVLDVGGAFAQRRVEQSASDLAALAGANAYMTTGDAATAIAEARLIAKANGYADGDAGASVTITIDPAPGTGLAVAITAAHTNYFAAILGQPTWSIAVSASASAAIPDTAIDPAPFVFSGDLFGADGNPKALYTRAGCAASGCAWPLSSDPDPGLASFAWTDFSGAPAVDASVVDGLIDGSHPLVRTLALGDVVGQARADSASASLALIAAHMVGKAYPVAVVSAGTNKFLGWASFMVTGAGDSSLGQVLGYFLAGHQSPLLSASGSCASNCPHYLGSFFLGITN